MLARIITFPQIDPEIFSITLGGFNLALRWYAVAYIVGIMIGWWLISRALRTPALWPANTPPMARENLDDLLTWIIVGIIAGGRLGFVIFYQPAHFIANPVEIPMVWQGGMSFHGGFLGVVVAVTAFSWRRGLALGSMADALAFAAPAGIFLVRIANFIKPELWGRPSDVTWAVAFPGAGQDCPGIVGICGRHPSQLYEAALEGLILGAVILFLVWRRGWLRTPWAVTGVFFLGYGASRFVVELFREADAQFISPDNPLGYVIGTGSAGLSMGQVLSLPMVLIGVYALRRARRSIR